MATKEEKLNKLITTDKTSLIGAINEVAQEAAEVGTVKEQLGLLEKRVDDFDSTGSSTELDTEDKTVVGAINEIHGKVGTLHSEVGALTGTLNEEVSALQEETSTLHEEVDTLHDGLADLSGKVSNVPAQVKTVEDALAAHTAESASAAHKASSITVVNPETKSTQDMQSFAEQLFTNVSNGKGLIASAITDKGVATDAKASFSVMAENILKMEHVEKVSEQDLLEGVCMTSLKKGDAVKVAPFFSADSKSAVDLQFANPTNRVKMTPNGKYLFTASDAAPFFSWYKIEYAESSVSLKKMPLPASYSLGQVVHFSVNDNIVAVKGEYNMAFYKIGENQLIPAPMPAVMPFFEDIIKLYLAPKSDVLFILSYSPPFVKPYRFTGVIFEERVLSSYSTALGTPSLMTIGEKRATLWADNNVVGSIKMEGDAFNMDQVVGYHLLGSYVGAIQHYRDDLYLCYSANHNGYDHHTSFELGSTDIRHIPLDGNWETTPSVTTVKEDGFMIDKNGTIVIDSVAGEGIEVVVLSKDSYRSINTNRDVLGHSSTVNALLKNNIIVSIQGNTTKFYKMEYRLEKGFGFSHKHAYFGPALEDAEAGKKGKMKIEWR